MSLVKSQNYYLLDGKRRQKEQVHSFFNVLKYLSIGHYHMDNQPCSYFASHEQIHRSLKRFLRYTAFPARNTKNARRSRMYFVMVLMLRSCWYRQVSNSDTIGRSACHHRFFCHYFQTVHLPHPLHLLICLCLFKYVRLSPPYLPNGFVTCSNKAIWGIR